MDVSGEDVLHILNGQVMYDEFKRSKKMNSDYAPFNEAMCVNATTKHVFSEEFIETRALGHNDSVEGYMNKVISPLNHLFNASYECIVLWFGDDMFCQMNLLTLLAYLEQSNYKGTVLYNRFREDECEVKQIELELGHYHTVYADVLLHHSKPSVTVDPVMHQAIELYFMMLKDDNPVMQYIQEHKHVSTDELIERLIARFPTIGYGDVQYKNLINRIK
ncbi:AraC family transcriptional regulator [Thalassobacillus sp. CUG 92003]|uniref:AraC family transcriptional regulator n=1 Tax=Thalassobacillus sp. CUG 92003 TaxID=2736641 RepID=UPI0015E6A444|nr:AraC family transcriptional regulator [Thalassobacillus sp. CUG 92003]